MDILSLTTSEAIRAVLGVSVETQEMDDQVFLDLEISDEIEMAFSTWMPATMTISSILSSGNPLAVKALRACAKYTGALLLVPSLLTATAKQQSDGQNLFQRQDRDLELLKSNLESLLDQAKSVLLALFGAPAAAPTWFGSARPDFDPVTG